MKQKAKLLKKGKAADSEGIVAEIVKCGGPVLMEAIASLFTDVLAEEKEPPASWRHSRVTVLFMKGDPKLPQNYRPISVLPI